MIIQRAGLSRRGLLQASAGLVIAAPAVLRGARPAMAAISDDLVKAAQNEGSISYYHNSDIETTGKWTAAFSQKYNIEMKNMRMPSYPLFDRWLNEERVGRHLADLIQITDPTLLSMAHKQGFIADYVPAGDADIPDDVKEKGVWYGLFTDPMGIAYNFSKVTPEEDKLIQTGGWAALADPRWKDRFGTATPASGGSSYAFCYMFLVTLRDQYGPDFFKKEAANNPDIYASKAPLFERLAAGEYALMDQGSTNTISTYYLKGAPVRWSYPEPTPIALTTQSVCKSGPHPNAARLFQEWCLTAEGQAEWLKYNISGATNPAVEDPREAAKKDWFAESWYHKPTKLYTSYLKDEAFADPKKPVIAEWNEIFNYQGGRKG
jgi:ABC-type Fe3+ transport system substrate-binding protein